MADSAIVRVAPVPVTVPEATGAAVSMRTVMVAVALRVPEVSMARKLTRWMPWAEIVTERSAFVEPTVLPSTVSSVQAIPRLLVAEGVKVTGVGDQTSVLRSVLPAAPRAVAVVVNAATGATVAGLR